MARMSGQDGELKGFESLSAENYKNTKKIISRKAWLLVGLFGFTSHDVPDIEQELMLALFQKLKASDLGKSANAAFALKIIEQKINDIISHRQAACRDWRKCQTSLNEVIITEDAGALERIDVLKCEDERNYGLELDIEGIIAPLPQDLKTLSSLLKHYSPCEAFRESGLPENVFQQQLKRLRQIFRDSMKL